MPSLLTLEGPNLGCVGCMAPQLGMLRWNGYLGDARALIPNGKARGYAATRFDPASLRRGMLVEMEHTSDPAIAQQIAMDHLVEDSRYYQKLASIHLDGLRGINPIGAIKVLGVLAIVAIGLSLAARGKKNKSLSGAKRRRRKR